MREVLEAPVFAEWAPGTEVRGLVILLRNGVLFLVSGAALALYSAQPTPCLRGVCAIMVFVFSFSVTRRWPPVKERNERILRVILSIALTGGCMFLVFNASEPALAAKAMALVAAASLTALLAGFLGYYNSCDIVLHAGLAAAAVGIQLPEPENDGPEKSTLQIAIEMVERAAALRATTEQAVGALEE